MNHCLESDNYTKQQDDFEFYFAYGFCALVLYQFNYFLQIMKQF